MIPSISTYEEIPEPYFVNEMFGVGRIDVIKLRPTYTITAEMVDDISKLFSFANAQGLNGNVAGALEFDVSYDSKQSAGTIVTVTCSVAKNRI